MTYAADDDADMACDEWERMRGVEEEVESLLLKYIHHVPEAAFESLKEHGEYKKMPSGAEWVSLNNIHFCKESKEK